MKTISASGLRALLFSGLACTLAVASGCQGPITEDAVHPRVEFTNRAKQALMGGDLRSVNGTYTGCANRSGPWSAASEGYPMLRHPALSVVKDDINCVLTVTSLSTDLGPEGEYSAQTPMLMTDQWVVTNASRFEPEMFSGEAFFANAKLSAADFAADFVLDVVYSQSLDDISPNANGEIAGTAQPAQSGTSRFTSADASDYTIATAALEPLVVVVAQDGTVVSATGSLTLAKGSHEGEGYVILSASTDGLFGTLDEIYNNAKDLAPAPTPIVQGGDLKIPAVAFDLVGKSTADPGAPNGMQLVRAIIIRNMTHGVPAYQELDIRFTAPARSEVKPLL